MSVFLRRFLTNINKKSENIVLNIAIKWRIYESYLS